MKVYFISGLGADEQMFQRITLPNTFEMIHLPWIAPLIGESFAKYAQRLSQSINLSEPFVLVGLSLGGMMAIEMNKFLRPAATILISSAVNKSALPTWFKLAGMLRLYKFTPNYFYQHPSFLSHWLLGTKSDDDRCLLKKVMRKASPRFVRWAVPRILDWDNVFIPSNLWHLHGTADIILPIQKRENVIAVSGGTHFMVYNRAKEINQRLTEILKEIA